MAFPSLKYLQITTQGNLQDTEVAATQNGCPIDFESVWPTDGNGSANNRRDLGTSRRQFADHAIRIRRINPNRCG
jgi:hypothetical protein